jgi:STE24 endopeptidase
MIARSLDAGLIFSGLAFVFLLSLLQGVFSLPFSLYSTFIIEQNYGFNTTTLRTFTMDLLKGLVVGAILGGLLFAGVLAAFMFFGPSGWLLAWLGTTVFQIIILFLAPAYLLPLFNKFTPLPEGSLRSKLESYAHQQNITLAGVFTMDGSKRSTKANAFLAGFGATRRLVLFDTLIERHTEDEVLGVFAHEVGHLKHKHVLKHIAFSTITSAALFGLVGFALTKPELSRAFGVFSPSHYSQLVFVALLWGTIGRFISLIPNAVSRKHEYEADDFAAKTTEKPLDLAKGLIKLTAHAMAPLDPHPLSVLFDYSHPPLLERVKALTRKSTR